MLVPLLVPSLINNEMPSHAQKIMPASWDSTKMKETVLIKASTNAMPNFEYLESYMSHPLF